MTGRSDAAVRLRSWWSWALEPWRSVGLAVALVGSLSLPAVLLSAGPMFEEAAADEIATRVVAGLDPGPAGLNLTMIGSARESVLDPLTESVDERFERLDFLAPATRLLVTDPVPVEPTVPTDEARRRGRLFAQPGAVEALDVVEGDVGTDGVWITETLAGELGVGAGDTVAIQGSPVPVAGVYRDLWRSELNDFWAAVPSQFVPRFQRVFNSPEFELVVLDDELFVEIGPSARVVWEAPLAAPPRTYDDLARMTSGYRSLERDLVRETEIGDRYREFARDPLEPPSLFTALLDARDDADALIAELRDPVRTATLAGAGAGLALSSLGAIFMIRRRRSEYRLLVADGDGWWRFFGRANLQYAAPAVVGAFAGVAIAWGTVRILGPSGTADLGAVPWADVLAVSALACVLAGVVTAFAVLRLADGLERDVGRPTRSWLYLLGGVAVAMWIQVGDETSGGIGPLVVAFPFVGIVAGVAVAVALLRLVLHLARRTGRRLPTSLFLAWRALTGSETGALLLAGALGLAAGLAVLSSVFVSTVDTALADKAVTVVGSRTRLDIADRADAESLPPGSTILREQASRVGEAPVQLLVLDPETFATAVEWPSSFGRSPDELVEQLGEPIDGVVPVAVAGRREVPEQGEFGVQRVFPYEVVTTVRSFPLATGPGTTLVMRADQLDRIAQERFADGLEEVGSAEALAAEALGETIDYETPLDAFSQTIVSQAPAEEVTRAAEAAGLRVREVVTLADESNRVDNSSTRWAFDYLRLLAAIGGMTAVGAMALYLAERRSQREVATVMTDQMGVRPSTNVVASVTEMVGLVVVALVTGAAVALAVAWRVFPAFEPDPDISPVARLVVRVVDVVGVVVVAVVAVGITAALVQRSAANAARGRVLRG